MAHVTGEYHDGLMEIRSQVFCGTFQDTESNQKLLFILLRLFVYPVTGKPFFTRQEIADAFGKKDRHNMQNFMQEFQKCEGDFLQYLDRKNIKKDQLFPLIEEQVLSAPLLSIVKHYFAFCEAHRQERICEQTFRKYVNAIPAMKILKRIRQLRFNQEPLLDVGKRCFRLAKHIFANRWVSRRKYAAKTLQRLAGDQVASYIDEHILRCWRSLTLSLTSNASERFNRKIEKCLSARYGLPSVGSARVYLRGLWLKELLLHGQKHMAATSEFAEVDLSTICQEEMTADRILHFFQAYCPSLAEKLG